MPGFSISLLLLPSKEEVNAPAKDLILSLLDEKSETPGWKWSAPYTPLAQEKQIAPSHQVEASKANIKSVSVPDSAAFLQSIKRAANALIEAEPEITRMDSIAGDGDCGLTLKVSPRCSPISPYSIY